MVLVGLSANDPMLDRPRPFVDTLSPWLPDRDLPKLLCEIVQTLRHLTIFDDPVLPPVRMLVAISPCRTPRRVKCVFIDADEPVFGDLGDCRSFWIHWNQEVTWLQQARVHEIDEGDIDNRRLPDGSRDHSFDIGLVIRIGELVETFSCHR